MTDITMCTGDGCPLKDKCYRHNAPQNDIRQSYLIKPPYRTEKGKTVCDLFWLERREYHGKKEK